MNVAFFPGDVDKESDDDVDENDGDDGGVDGGRRVFHVVHRHEYVMFRCEEADDRTQEEEEGEDEESPESVG